MLSALTSARIMAPAMTQVPHQPKPLWRRFVSLVIFALIVTQLDRSRGRRLLMLSVQHLDFVLIPTRNLDPRPPLSILSLLTSPSYRQSSVSTLDSWPSSLTILETSSCHCPVQFTVSQVSESVLRAHGNPKLHTATSTLYPILSSFLSLLFLSSYLSYIPYLSLSHRK